MRNLGLNAPSPAEIPHVPSPHSSSNITRRVSAPGMPDRECQMHGDFCLIEGDVQVGQEGQFGVALSGILSQPEAANVTDRRRLDIVNGFNAFYWPNGVVRGRDVCGCV